MTPVTTPSDATIRPDDAPARPATPGAAAFSGAEGLTDWHARALERSRLVAERGVFFLCGCQKSGTTWLQRLVDQHPSVRCDGEGHPGDILAPAVAMAIDAANREQRLARKVADDSATAAKRFVIDQTLGRYVEEAPDPEAVRQVGDKTPESAAHLRRLIELYPHARVIHVIRDGRDGTVSGWAHHGRAGTQSNFATFADYAEIFAKHFWVPYILAAREVGRSLGDRYLEVRYERMLEAPHEETRRLFAHLGVEHDGATVEQACENASFRKLSGGRRPGEEDASSHWRKGVAGEWSEAFDDEALVRFERHAGPLMDALGYPRGR